MTRPKQPHRKKVWKREHLGVDIRFYEPRKGLPAFIEYTDGLRWFRRYLQDGIFSVSFTMTVISPSPTHPRKK